MPNNNEHGCGNSCGKTNNGYLIILVLYILLAILLGSYLVY